MTSNTTYSTHNGDDAPQNCATLSLTSVLDGGGWSTPRPGCT